MWIEWSVDFRNRKKKGHTTNNGERTFVICFLLVRFHHGWNHLTRESVPVYQWKSSPVYQSAAEAAFFFSICHPMAPTNQLQIVFGFSFLWFNSQDEQTSQNRIRRNCTRRKRKKRKWFSSCFCIFICTSGPKNTCILNCKVLLLRGAWENNTLNWSAHINVTRKTAATDKGFFSC